MASPTLMKAGRRRNQLPEPFQELAVDEQYWPAVGPEGEITQHRGASRAPLPEESERGLQEILFLLPSSHCLAPKGQLPSGRLYNTLLFLFSFLISLKPVKQTNKQTKKDR